VSALQEEVSELKLTLAARDDKIAEQADEIVRLKGLPPRPKFKGKPSGVELAGAGRGAKKNKGDVGRGSKRDKLAVTAEIRLRGSRA